MRPYSGINKQSLPFTKAKRWYQATFLEVWIIFGGDWSGGHRSKMFFLCIPQNKSSKKEGHRYIGKYKQSVYLYIEIFFCAYVPLSHVNCLTTCHQILYRPTRGRSSTQV